MGQRQSTFPGAHLLVLPGDRLLVWEVHGRTRLRDAAGTWAPEVRLPMQGVLDVQVDGDGFLASGSTAPGHSLIVRMSAAGSPLERWELAGDGAFALRVDARGRRAVTRAGLVPLGPNGTLGELQRLPPGDLPIVFDREGTRVVCHTADLAMDHRAHAGCERDGSGGWKFEGNFLDPPIACGPWLVLRDGARLQGLAIRSWDTGRLVGRSSHRLRPAFACADGGDALLVAERDLHLVRLPKLGPVWRLSTGGKAVGEVAIGRSFIAYAPDDSIDIVVVPRPPTVTPNR